MEQNNIVKTKLGIVDDDKLIVQLLSGYFKNTERIETILVANGGNEFLEKIKSDIELPEVILLDLRMKDGDGLMVLEELKKMNSTIKIIVLTTFYKASFFGQMLKLGVHAFLPKEIDQEELVEIIETVKNQGFYFTPEQVTVMRRQVSGKIPKLQIDEKQKLTNREIEVLELLCQQLSTKEIADKLFLSVKTIESHKTNLYVKTGAKNTAGLIIYAVQNKIINPDELVLLS
ncbi:response regulator transcription factor [Aureivirga marina]|uniref:response regulator transcription factor n=1 Tax=Aureivirga marina TaxID=1182451 RepID=UPI0018C9C305|nr:response regulator transcription factor [Aureivirga marina]